MISVIIIAKNEEEMIKDCLESVDWAEEIILVDTGSKDKTLAEAQKICPKIKIVKTDKGSFSDWRNLGFKKAKENWILYLDADERVSVGLKKEILSIVGNQRSAVSALQISRKNFYFDKQVKYGGSWPDYVIRLFKRKNFVSWQGIIHESPQFKGKLGTLKNPFIHFTHRNLTSSLDKSSKWTYLEAKLFYKAHHPPVTWWRLIKVGLQEFFKRCFWLGGYKDGFVGIVEAYVQAINRVMVYVYLWEMQQKPPLKEKLKKIEAAIK